MQLQCTRGEVVGSRSGHDLNFWIFVIANTVFGPIAKAEWKSTATASPPRDQNLCCSSLFCSRNVSTSFSSASLIECLDSSASISFCIECERHHRSALVTDSEMDMARVRVWRNPQTHRDIPLLLQHHHMAMARGTAQIQKKMSGRALAPRCLGDRPFESETDESCRRACCARPDGFVGGTVSGCLQAGS